MRLTLNLDFNVPIWRFFYGDQPQLPYEFTYNNKIYTNAITIIQFKWDTLVLIEQLKKDIHLYQNPILCVPNNISLIEYKKHFNCPVILAGHNAFINEEIYTITLDSNNKKYDLIINSCFESYKRRYLANKIDNTIHIGYYQSNSNEYVPKNGFCPNFNNK